MISLPSLHAYRRLLEARTALTTADGSSVVALSAGLRIPRELCNTFLAGSGDQVAEAGHGF